jgi:hypothetical protein
MGKYGTVRQATDGNVIRRVRVARSVTKATDTHSEYVILITFPLQQWLRERAPSVASAYIACLVFCACDEIQVVGPLRKTVIPMYSSSSIGTTTLSWVSACSTVVDHSQQEGFTECRCQRHVKPPIWRRTRDLERSNFRHKRPPASEATRANLAAEGGSMGEKWPRNFAESDDFHVTFGFFYMP